MADDLRFRDGNEQFYSSQNCLFGERPVSLRAASEADRRGSATGSLDGLLADSKARLLGTKSRLRAVKVRYPSADGLGMLCKAAIGHMAQMLGAD